tara:strand:- start:46 stop:1080 length:1035 start_codon:yes stop_codon:yes gene_type:complete
MSEPIFSEDGFWELSEDEWIPTQKQKLALEGGAIPHDYIPVISDDGFWELIEGKWLPTEKQNIALQNGAIPHDLNTSSVTYYYANVKSQNHTTLYIVFGGFFVAFFLTMVLIIASISPDFSDNSDNDLISYDGGDGPTFYWEYQSNDYSISLPLNKATYDYYKSKDHTCCYEDEDYLEYVTPNAEYVRASAKALEDMAISVGFTTKLEKAEFILAFVGAIPYEFDPDDDFDHPKYPIETLWENSGDCEDSSALYASLMEAIGYQTLMVMADVKAESSEPWEAHVLIGIYIPNHSGEFFTVSGDSKSYYYAETTAWYDFYYDEGYEGIGIDSWYDMRNISTYSIE